MLSIRDLSFRYKKAEHFTLQGLTLEIKAGERVTVLGPSQSGKSTLALCLNGLIPRLIKGEFQGRIQVGERTTQNSRPRELASRVGVLFQDFESQLISTRVDLEIAFGPENLGLPREEIGVRIRGNMELMGLNGLADREPATLSGGQKQLLALAAVLALQPQTLILDEPTSDLDPWRVEDLLQTLEILRQRENLAMVLLGQDLRLTEHSDRIILLSEGKVVAEGKPGEILRQVETFRRLGLQPHPLAALFFDLGQADLPLDLNAAAALGRRLGWDNPDPPPAAASGPVAGPEILALRQVDFGYPERPLLWEKLSLSFYQGEIVAILGANGSGKTTLLKLLRGLLHPQAGELWIRPDSEQSGGPARLGFVFQNPDYQIFAEEVGEEVAFGPRQLGLSETEVKGRVDQALSQVHLLDQAAEDPFSLTKGQRQRLAVAAVLAMAPALIILDEPTTGLDHGGQMGMMELIRELNQRGHTIIMVTHSMWAAAAYASRLIIMQEGRIILDGPTREVLSQEEALAGCNLFPPLVTRLARLLGWSALTAAEFLGRVKGRQHDRRN